GTSSLIGNLGINSHSIVSHVQQKLGISVRDFRFDPLRLRMAERVSQCLAGNAVDFIAQHRIEVALFPFYQDTHAGSSAVPALQSQLLAQSGQRLWYVFVADDGLAQV